MRFLLITLSALLFCNSSYAKQKTEILKEISLEQIESIMLDDEEVRKINKAFDFFGEGREFIVEEKKEKGPSDEEKEKMKLSKEMILIEAKSKIYLGSILYFSDKVWSVWINDERITSLSNSPDKEIFIENINGKKIDAVWLISASKWKILMGQDTAPTPKTNNLNQIKINFTLHPNQTYFLRTNKVIEGNHQDKSPVNTSQTANNKSK